MANISAIKLPNGNTYTIKDSVSGYTTNTGTVTSVAAGTGLITNQTNNAAITSSGTIKTNLNSETSLGTIGTTTKLYAVGVDDNGQLCVDVPWENSDTKVTSSAKTTGGTIYLVGSSSSTTTTSTLSKHASLSAIFSTDTSTDGYTRLTLGNSKTSSTEGGKKGILRLYGTGSGRIDLTVAAASNYTITLPNKTGTIALTTDIPSSSSTPTADTTAKFDNDAHMNSTDMSDSDVSDFIDGLGVGGGGLSDIIADLTYDSGVKSAYLNYCKCRRIGHVVHVWGESSNGWSITQGGYRAMTTLEAEFRPPQIVRFVCGALGGTQQITGYVDTNGIVYLYTTSTTAYWNFSVTYLVP